MPVEPSANVVTYNPYKYDTFVYKSTDEPVFNAKDEYAEFGFDLTFRKKWHAYLLKMPLIGEMILNSNLAQIAMVYGNLSGAGVPVIEALEDSLMRWRVVK